MEGMLWLVIFLNEGRFCLAVAYENVFRRMQIKQWMTGSGRTGLFKLDPTRTELNEVKKNAWVIGQSYTQVRFLPFGFHLYIKISN